MDLEADATVNWLIVVLNHNHALLIFRRLIPGYYLAYLLLGRQVNLPKLSLSFAGTQQIICGQNCTFLIQSNGSVLSIGEGSYGRLGLGNSDDMTTQTVISALQGIILLHIAYDDS